MPVIPLRLGDSVKVDHVLRCFYLTMHDMPLDSRRERRPEDAAYMKDVVAALRRLQESLGVPYVTVYTWV